MVRPRDSPMQSWTLEHDSRIPHRFGGDVKLLWTDDGSASKRRTKRPNAGSFAIVAPIDKRQYKPPVRWSLIRRGEVAYHR